MARLDIVPVNVVSGYPTLPLTAELADFVFVPASIQADGISFTTSGRELLLVRNTTAGALTVTVNSSPYLGRSGDIAAYSLGANEFCAFYITGPGWEQAGRKVHAMASAIGVHFAVLRLPHID